MWFIKIMTEGFKAAVALLVVVIVVSLILALKPQKEDRQFDLQRALVEKNN